MAFVNARTAKNKLKLDLFERRMKVLTTIRQILNLAFEYEDRLDENTSADLVNAVNDAEYVFNKNVHEHLSTTTLRLFEEYVAIKYKVKNIKYRLANNIISGEESKKMLQIALDNQTSAARALYDDEHKINELMAPFLRLSH